MLSVRAFRDAGEQADDGLLADLERQRALFEACSNHFSWGRGDGASARLHLTVNGRGKVVRSTLTGVVQSKALTTCLGRAARAVVFTPGPKQVDLALVVNDDVL